MNSDQIARLDILLKHSGAQLEKAVTDLNQSQIDVANGRTAYFDRLTIGSGAAIAAIVSYLGAHSASLHPAWVLRSSLVSLVVAMIAGLYRGYRYPYYIMQARKVTWIEAERKHQQNRGDSIQAHPYSVDLTTGQAINRVLSSQQFSKSNAEVDEVIRKSISKREALLRETHIAEGLCVFSLTVSMVSLVWLTLSNF